MAPEHGMEGEGGGALTPVARLAMVLAALFFLAGVALLAHTASRLLWPELPSSAYLSYGRVLPAAMGTLLFGWVTVAYLGYAFAAVPRLVGARLVFPVAALGVVLLAAGGAAGGAALLVMGQSEGGRWLEFPLVIDAALLAAYAGAAGLLVLTARRGDRERLPLPAWFLIGGAVWLALTQLVASIPGLGGLAAEVQSGFTGAALFGMWGAVAGLGVAYSVVGRLIDGARFHERLGRIGFWSLALTWGWTAGRLLQNGPTKDWIETAPVVFGAGLVVATLAVAADFATALRGRWAEVRGVVPLQLVIAGIPFLVVAAAASFVGSLRSVSSVVQFTAWESGVEAAALLGAFTLFAAGGITEALSPGRGWGKWWGRLVVWPVTLGAGVALFSRLASGLQQGLSWLAGVQTGAYENANAGFGESLAPLRGFDFVYLAGLGLVAIGSLALLVRVVRFGLAGGSRHGGGSRAVYPEQSLRVVIRGAVALFALVAAGAFAFPAIDSNPAASVLAADTRDFSADPVAELGRQVYVREGCWYCHTQQVRQVITDVGLGPVSQPGDYAFDPVGLAGARRIGPDLTHQASREDTGSAAWVRSHLSDPRADHAWSVMPSFDYLDEEELTALSVYVSGLE